MYKRKISKITSPPKPISPQPSLVIENQEVNVPKKTRNRRYKGHGTGYLVKTSQTKQPSEDTFTSSDTIVVGTQTQTTSIPFSTMEDVLEGSSQANIGIESALQGPTNQTSYTFVSARVEDAMDLDQSIVETPNTESNDVLVTSRTIVEDPQTLVHGQDDAQTSEPQNDVVKLLSDTHESHEPYLNLWDMSMHEDSTRDDTIIVSDSDSEEALVRTEASPSWNSEKDKRIIYFG